MTHPATKPLEAMGKQEAKSAQVKQKIMTATIYCLGEMGYAETSINRIVEKAEVSKGALQHHFPSKDDLMTATAEYTLSNMTYMYASAAKAESHKRSVKIELMKSWVKGANTQEFKALLEILVAMRTDQGLRKRLQSTLQQWQNDMMRVARSSYEATSGDAADVAMAFNMNSAMVMGLLLQQIFFEDENYSMKAMDNWLELIGPSIKPK